MKNLKILIRHLIKEYWGEPSDGAAWQQPPGDSIFYRDHTLERTPTDEAPSPDRLNKDENGEERFEIERMTIEDWIKEMGLEDKDIPGKRYK